ncbi:MAG: hypothetical protein KF883_07790 [Thermomicrobiales bacterium]|nr:hypothetical protein [Thermomicrobiales bacterium]
MPIRVTSKGPDPVGPKPFSQEWLASPEEVRQASPSRQIPTLPREGLAAAAVVLMLVLVPLLFPKSIGLFQNNNEPDIASIAQNGDGDGTPEPESNQAGGAEGEAGTGALSEATPEAEQQTSTVDMAGAILPDNRILSYYGFPGEQLMGILGEYPPDQLLDILRDQAAEYEAVDPSRPVVLALEVITSVAQGWQGNDGDYLAYIPREKLMEYVEFTEANDMLLILDMQFGRKSVQEEFEAVREFLLYPHVHLALDPEFAVDEGEVPSQVIGQIDAADVQYAMEELAALSAENNLPPKLLIVHQFVEQSITNREQIELIPGVQFVLEIDGYGSPDAKRATYAAITAGSPSEFFGFKLWYNPDQDYPLMTPAEVLDLEPSPDLIIYQ